MQILSGDEILYLNRNDVEKICQNVDSIAVIRDVFHLHGTQQTNLPDEAYLSWVNTAGEHARSLNMPSFVGGHFQAAGTKIINANIHNLQRNLPRASGLTLLFDTTSGRIAAIMEGAYISSLRTASVTVLATRLLKSSELQSVAIIGGGVLAVKHIQLLLQYIPGIKQITLFDIVPNKDAELRKQIQPCLDAYNVTFRTVSTPEEAIVGADLVVPVTTTTTGYIQFSWLKPGALLVNVSLDDALPEVVLRAQLLVVDDWQLVKNDPRRLLGRMYREGTLIGPDDALPTNDQPYRRVDALLAELVNGQKPGRQQDTDIIVVNPFGLSIEDIALASNIYHQALEQGVGQMLPR